MTNTELTNSPSTTSHSPTPGCGGTCPAHSALGVSRRTAIGVGVVAVSPGGALLLAAGLLATFGAAFALHRTARSVRGSGAALPTSRLVTPVLLVLAAAQLLIGTMSYLMPTTIGGGPAATRAGLAELNRAGVVRVVVFNAALLGWLFAPSSIARIVCSIIACACLVAFIPLMVRGVRAQRAVIMEKAAARK